MRAVAAARASGALGEEHGASDRLLRRQAHVGDGHRERRERARHLPERRTADGRAERVPHRAGHRPAQDDRGDEIGEERAADREHDQREQDHEDPPDPPRHSRQVRRGDDDHRDREAHPDQRELWGVARPERHRERVDEVGPVREEGQQPTHDPRGKARDGDVAPEPPAAGEQHPDHDDAERPQRQELVRELRDIERAVGEVVQRVGEILLEPEVVTGVERERHEEHRAHDRARRITRTAAPQRVVAVAHEQLTQSGPHGPHLGA